MKIHMQLPYTPLPLSAAAPKPEGWTADVLAQEEIAGVAQRRPLQTRRRIGSATTQSGSETEESERKEGDRSVKDGDRLDFLA